MLDQKVQMLGEVLANIVQSGADQVRKETEAPGG